MNIVSSNYQVGRSNSLGVIKKPESKASIGLVSFEGSKAPKQVKASKLLEKIETLYNKLPEGLRNKISSAVSYIKKGAKLVLDKLKEGYKKVKSFFTKSASTESAEKKSPNLGKVVSEVKEEVIYDAKTGKIPQIIKKTQGGHLVEEIMMGEKGTPIKKINYVKGKKVSESTYKNDVIRETLLFNKSGRKTDRYSYNIFGEQAPGQNILDHEQFLADGKRVLTKYSHNGDSVIAKLVYSADGTLLNPAHKGV